jgi:hypothetical protein
MTKSPETTPAPLDEGQQRVMDATKALLERPDVRAILHGRGVPNTTPAVGRTDWCMLAETLATERNAQAAEIERLRSLVTWLTNVAENLAGELTDPGTEALAAIHCGRHFIYS